VGWHGWVSVARVSASIAACYGMALGAGASAIEVGNIQLTPRSLLCTPFPPPIQPSASPSHTHHKKQRPRCLQVPDALLAVHKLSSPEVLQHVASRYDCVLESLQIKTERALLVNFLQPVMPFGYILVAPGPKPRSSDFLETVFNFLKPFTWEVWVLIVSLWAVSSVALLIFENKEEHGEEGRCSRCVCACLHDVVTTLVLLQSQRCLCLQQHKL